MKSDEFSGKMLDDHIEVFCYCNLIITGICFGAFCISIYEKGKRKLLWSVLFILELCLCCI